MNQPAAQVAPCSLRPALQNPGRTFVRKTHCSSHIRSSCEQYEALSHVSWQLIHGVERIVNDTAARAHRTEPQQLLKVLRSAYLHGNPCARAYLKSPGYPSDYRTLSRINRKSQAARPPNINARREEMGEILKA